MRQLFSISHACKLAAWYAFNSAICSGTVRCFALQYEIFILDFYMRRRSTSCSLCEARQAREMLGGLGIAIFLHRFYKRPYAGKSGPRRGFLPLSRPHNTRPLPPQEFRVRKHPTSHANLKRHWIKALSYPYASTLQGLPLCGMSCHLVLRSLSPL